MAGAKVEAKIRPMVLGDLDAIFFIDHKIRATGQAITYANFTTEHIFHIDRRHSSGLAKPVSYADLITGDVSELLSLGFVGEIEGHVRGFILGAIAPVGEAAARTGDILILGVHPDYQRKGMATELVKALCQKYRSEGIRKVRVSLDQRDKQLLSFFEHMGFSVGYLINYSKTL